MRKLEGSGGRNRPTSGGSNVRLPWVTNCLLGIANAGLDDDEKCGRMYDFCERYSDALRNHGNDARKADQDIFSEAYLLVRTRFPVRVDLVNIAVGVMIGLFLQLIW